MDRRVYRHKLSQEITDLVKAFASVHQHDSQKEYKTNWEEWVEKNAEAIGVECRRLRVNGYEGDVVDKLYKSGRYYHRTRKPSSQLPGVNSGRRAYIGVSRPLLLAIDAHLLMSLKCSTDCKPALLHQNFISSKEGLIEAEVSRLSCVVPREEVLIKIKKTYKNRYYVCLRNT